MRCEYLEALESYRKPDMVQATARDSSELTKRLLWTTSDLIQCQSKARGVYGRNPEVRGGIQNKIIIVRRPWKEKGRNEAE